jgi:hypothetical protein
MGSFLMCFIGGALQAVIKEVVGTHVLLTRWLFVCDILRRCVGSFGACR